MDDLLGYGRNRGGSNGRDPARIDDYDVQESSPPRRPEQAPPPCGPQGSRAQPARYEQAYGDDNEGNNDDDQTVRWCCTTSGHDDVDDHAIGRCGENEGWCDTRRAAEAAL